MPLYDYRCPRCSTVQDIFHSMKESPQVVCDTCHIPMKRVYHPVSFTVRNTKARQSISSRFIRESEMRKELASDYGIEKVVPLDGQSVSDVYNEIKANSGKVKDRMQLEDARRKAKDLKHGREWRKNSLKTSKKMWEVSQEKKAEAAAKKRAITL